MLLPQGPGNGLHVYMQWVIAEHACGQPSLSPISTHDIPPITTAAPLPRPTAPLRHAPPPPLASRLRPPAHPRRLGRTILTSTKSAAHGASGRQPSFATAHASSETRCVGQAARRTRLASSSAALHTGVGW